MLQKPDLDEGKIIEAVLENYGIRIRQLEFLPVGADQNTFLFRGTSQEGSPYFIKLRSGIFEELSVILPKFLWRAGNNAGHTSPGNLIREVVDTTWPVIALFCIHTFTVKTDIKWFYQKASGRSLAGLCG